MSPPQENNANRLVALATGVDIDDNGSQMSRHGKLSAT